MKCPNCRCVIPEASEYCSYCGYTIRTKSEYTGSAPTYPVYPSSDYAEYPSNSLYYNSIYYPYYASNGAAAVYRGAADVSHRHVSLPDISLFDDNGELVISRLLLLLAVVNSALLLLILNLLLLLL